MMLAGADAAVLQKPGLQRLQILAVTCGRIEACARGCQPVLEGIADSPPAERFILLRRCPDIAAAVPAASEPEMIAAAQAFVLDRLLQLLPKARPRLTEADARRLTCDLAVLRGERC
jgi:hypothetical protein